jgi:acyl-CoA reductase-like NAD-dependent aldehyde dehydrogenase
MVWKIIPAVLTGNTIIIKPSPFTPLCDIRIVEAAQQFFPPGVVQVVVGDDSLGPWSECHGVAETPIRLLTLYRSH